jgi:hypothetical protein
MDRCRGAASGEKERSTSLRGSFGHGLKTPPLCLAAQVALKRRIEAVQTFL